MKALTIIQPWATLIASGHKMNETRSWKTNYRGEVLIHAGKNPKDYTSGCYIDDPDGRHFQEAGITPNNFEELPRGSIIGKATLVNCIHINKEFRDHLKRSNPAEYAFGDYRIGRYAWVFENPVLFEKPIPARGRQGLWNWEAEDEQPAQPQINPMAALFGAMMQQAAKNQQEEGNPEGSEIESDDDE